MTVLAYLERIKKYARCSDSCFVVALIYIDRLIETQNVVLTSLNVHRLVITSLMLAAKFFDDLFYNNAFYAKLGGTHILMLSYRNITTKKTPSHHIFQNKKTTPSGARAFWSWATHSLTHIRLRISCSRRRM